MPHREAQISSSVRSFCSNTWSSFDFICQYNKQSSAKSLTWDRTTSGRSFMWQGNMRGPRTVPWGTPESTVTLFDCSPSTTTFIVLSFKKDDNHFKVLPWIPYESILCSNLSCGTVSNAFEKTRIATSTWIFLSNDLKRSCSVTNSCVSVKYPDLNPWFSWVNTLYCSKCLRMRMFKELKGVAGQHFILFSVTWLAPNRNNLQSKLVVSF